MRIVIDEDTGRIIEDDPRSIRPWWYRKRKEKVFCNTEIPEAEIIERLKRVEKRLEKKNWGKSGM